MRWRGGRASTVVHSEAMLDGPSEGEEAKDSSGLGEYLPLVGIQVERVQV